MKTTTILCSIVYSLCLSSCKTPSSAEGKVESANQIQENHVDVAVLEPRLQRGVNVYQGTWSGWIRRGLIFVTKKDISLTLVPYERPDTEGNVGDLTLRIAGYSDCTKPTRMSYDNDAYPINELNTISMEVWSCFGLFRVVVALPDPSLQPAAFGHNLVDVIVDIQEGFDQGRTVYSGQVERGGQE